MIYVEPRRKKIGCTGPLAWKCVLEPKNAHVPRLGRFRRGNSQSDVIDLLQMHHEILPYPNARLPGPPSRKLKLGTPRRRPGRFY